MKQTRNDNNNGPRAVAPRIRNAEVGCSSHLRGTTVKTTGSGPSPTPSHTPETPHNATFSGTDAELWCHLHIPKTAGSSLNAMLAETFGDDFGSHQDANASRDARIKSGHLNYRQVRRDYPDHKIFAILREPDKRLRSEIQHHYGRRDEPRYHKLGHLFASMIRDGFEPDGHTMAHPAVMAQCDNLLVRYLCSSPVGVMVHKSHLEEAKANLSNIDVLLFNESFAADTARLFDTFGAPCPEVRADNKRRTEPIFDELPSELEGFVMFDRELYKYAKEKAPAA